MGKIVGIDPGPEKTAHVMIDGNRIITKAIWSNEALRDILRQQVEEGMFKEADMAIEKIQCYGKPVGKSIIETCVMIGRILEIMKSSPCYLYARPTIKAYITGMRAKDPDVRRALIARFGGTKKGEPLHGVVYDMWSALAVAVYHMDMLKFEGKTT